MMRQIALNRIALVIIILLTRVAWSVSEGPTRGREKCTTVIVGKDATTDGSVILGHNEDWGEYEVPFRWELRKRHKNGETIKLSDGQVIPQVEETYAFLWPAALCSGFNEFQVMIVDNTGSCREDMVRSLTGIDMGELVAITLQRSRTAREAIETMGHLIDTYGYLCCDGPDGDIFSVAGPNEGWWMEVTTTGHWVAQRVPDDAFVVISNQFRIETIKPKDPSRFMASEKLVDYAKEQGWYDPTQGAFRFKHAFGRTFDNCFRREWRGNSLLGGKTFEQSDHRLAVVPAKKLGPRDIMEFLRDHYEGTEYDLTKGYEDGSPHHTAERGICRMYTDTSTIAQLRSWLPSEIGGLCWITVGTPCSSVYVPCYLVTVVESCSFLG